MNSNFMKHTHHHILLVSNAYNVLSNNVISILNNSLSYDMRSNLYNHSPRHFSLEEYLHGVIAEHMKF